MLNLIKVLHTAIWMVMTLATILIVRAVVTQEFRLLFKISISMIILEVIILALNSWTCPLTPLAAKYTDDRSDNFDIFLPLLIARYNKHIFGVIFVISILWHIVLFAID